MLPTPDAQPSAPSDAPFDRLSAYLAAELDYITANFPVISAGFRLTLRRIAVLTCRAVAKNKSNPLATRDGKEADILLVRILTEWPTIGEEKIAAFTLWYIKAVVDFNLTPVEYSALLEL